MIPLVGNRRWAATTLVFLAALAATAPSVNDFGYTYDEPAYRHSQILSAQWWERLGRGEFQAMLDPDALLYYWPYGHYGINFHPPLAGQCNLLTYAVFGGVLKDIPARRMASVIEFSLTIAVLFGFLAKRYGAWVGIVSACSLMLMPRVFGQAHLIDTDTAGMMLWTMAAFAFWKGLNEPGASGSRTAVGVLVGLAFVEKMGAVIVLLPILAWLALGPMLRSIRRRDWASWRDGMMTSFAMLAPLALALWEIVRLSRKFLFLQASLGYPADKITPAATDLFRDRPATWMPGAILLVPLVIWMIRRIRRHRPERPALEIWLAILAFGPAIAWLGNPEWWRETLPRLAHYYAITTTRRGVLPDIQILYFGQIYEYSLPWHNAWVLIAITVPASLLIAAIVGLWFAPWRDRLPWFFGLNLITLPILRMLATPGHDGVRLFLPTFVFLAAFAGWGSMGLARRIGRRWARPVVAALVLIPAAWGLIRVHPYELSYYNAFIGGPRGAWGKFELSYWYDAFTDDFLREMNADLPPKATVSYASDMSNPIMVPMDQQALGVLRADLQIEAPESVVSGNGPFPYVMLLTHDSKANGFSRLLFAMKPWRSRAPRQLDGLRVVTVADPHSVTVAWALQLMLDRPDPNRGKPDPPAAPRWVRSIVPPLARFWGDGLTKAPRLGVEPVVLDWARSDPASLRAAARWIGERGTANGSPDARRLMAVLDRYPARSARFLRAEPGAIVEAVEILMKRPDALRKVLLSPSYTDPATIGGYLD